MASRTNKNNLKTLINAFRVVTNSTDDLASCFARVSNYLLMDGVSGDNVDKDDAKNVVKVLNAVLADMRAEDEAAKKPAE